MMKGFSRQLIIVVLAAFMAGVLLMLSFDAGLDDDRSSMDLLPAMSNGSDAYSASYRKLLLSDGDQKNLGGQCFNSSYHGSDPHSAVVEPNRAWGQRCSKNDLVLTQGPSTPLPSGIPTYSVTILNVCVSGCDISDIHLSCGQFSSARLINPRIFRRLKYNDCLVNDGETLKNGGAIHFQYADSFPYDLAVSSLVC